MMMIETFFSGVNYWLVDHPTISQYEWKEGHTFGSSPLFITTTVTTYLSITLFLHYSSILPSVSAAALRYIAAAHNVILCLLSLLMATGCALAAIRQMPDPTWLVCFPANQAMPRGPIFFWGYVCYLSKFYEFVDTFLILLSGSRSRRLSFLHPYHHAVVVIGAYLGCAYAVTLLPVGVVTNSSVHVLMYAYYFLCAIGHRPRWKRLVTDCQIIQFVFLLAMSGLMLFYHFTGSGCSGMWAWLFNAVFSISLLGQFIHFHSTNYSSNNTKDDSNNTNNNDSKNK